MSELTERLKKALEFDKKLAKATFEEGDVETLSWFEFRDGAEYENARLRPMLDALIECAEACEAVGVWAKDAHMLAGPLAEAHNAFTRLNKLLSEGE